MNIRQQLSQIIRFGRLSHHIDSHLDEALTLAELADIACMSPYRLDRVFHDYAQETPINRVWRLRLLRARHEITHNPERPLLDIAINAGYGSAQAFSRAFRRLHGATPAACRHHSHQTAPYLRIEALPRLATQYIPYAGPARELSNASNELRARAIGCGIAREKRFGWQIGIQDRLNAKSTDTHIDVQAALLSDPLETRIPGLDSGYLGGQSYAVFSFSTGITIPNGLILQQRIEQETGWMLADGRWLRRCRNAQYLPSKFESCFELYLPVREQPMHKPVSAQLFTPGK